MDSTNLSAALEYAAVGFRVFPIKPRGKTPLFGGNWKDAATSDENQIRDWWTTHPDANIAIACGRMTKGDKFITVVDMDNKPDKSVNGFRELYECPFTAIECKKEHCALYARDKMANERKCAFAVIAENTSRLIGIDNSANGIWGELRDRY